MELEKIRYGRTAWDVIDAALITNDAKQSTRDYWLGRCVVDIARRRLWEPAGFASLANHMEIRLGWDPHTTAERKRTAEALEELSLMAEELRKGRIRWTAAREMTRIALRGTEEAWLEWSRGKTTHAITLAVKSRKPGDLPTDPPDPTLFRVKMAFECTSEEYAFFKAVIAHMRETLGPAGAELSEAALLKLAFAGGIEKMRLDITQCPSCQAAGIRVGGDVVPVESVFADVAKCDAQVVGPDGDIRSRHVPEPVERAVRIRANGTCEVPGCRHRYWCRVHHLKLFSEGGTHSLLNLMLLCDGHHRLHHDGILLIEGSRHDGFSFRHPDGTLIGQLPAYDRAKAFVNAFTALKQGGIPEGQARDALRVVREAACAGTEEDIVAEASRWLTQTQTESPAPAPATADGASIAGEAIAVYQATRVPQGTPRVRPHVESPPRRALWSSAPWPRRSTSKPSRRTPARNPRPSLAR